MSNIYSYILTEEQKELYILMLKECKKVQFSQKEASKILGVSVATMYRWRENSIGPSYKKLDSNSKNGTIIYPLQELVKFLTESNIQTV